MTSSDCKCFKRVTIGDAVSIFASQLSDSHSLISESNKIGHVTSEDAQGL